MGLIKLHASHPCDRKIARMGHPAFAGLKTASCGRFNSSAAVGVEELAPVLKLALGLELSFSAGCAHKHP